MLRLARLWWSFGLLGVSVVAWGCLTPAPPPPPDVPEGDKWVHFVSFFCLGLWFFQLQPDHKWRVFIVLSGYGLSIEVAQHFTATRTFEWLDWLADSFGVLLGWLASNTRLGDSLKTLEQRLGYL